MAQHLVCCSVYVEALVLLLPLLLLHGGEAQLQLVPGHREVVELRAGPEVGVHPGLPELLLICADKTPSGGTQTRGGKGSSMSSGDPPWNVKSKMG